MGNMIPPDLTKPRARHYLDYQGPLEDRQYVAIELSSCKVAFCSGSISKVITFIAQHTPKS